MGGDDTIEAVIRGMAGSKSRLGMIPVGTANNLAKSLGIPESPEAACELIAAGKTRKLDFGYVKMKKGKRIPFFELVAVGIAAAIYPDALHARKGRLSGIKGVIQKALQHEVKPKITVIMDGESNVTVETMLAIVTNVPLIGPNMLIDPNALMDDGYFDISMYPSFSKAELLAYSTQVMNQRTADNEKIQRYRARKITIKANPKLDVMADGIMLGKGTVKIKIKPGKLRVIAPEIGAGLERLPEVAGKDLPAPVAPVGMKEVPLTNN
jgi:diacylglycerol kinase family enzyme